MKREDAIWILELIRNRDARTDAEKDAVNAAIEALKAQLSKEGTTPAIPLTWIWKYIKWLQSLGNVLADQAAAHISVMVKKWRDEQNETD